MMSLAQPGETGSEPSSKHFHNPISALNLSSNNPFRNRAVSPTYPTPIAPSFSTDISPRLVSRNPFFDSAAQPQLTSTLSPKMPPAAGVIKSSPSSLSETSQAIGKLTLDDKPRVSSDKLRLRSGKTNVSPSRPSQRRENVPPRAQPGHVLQRSLEDANKIRRSGAESSSEQSNQLGELDIFADPSTSSRQPTRKARRNSDTSTAQRSSKPIVLDEEKSRQERRRRDKKPRESGEKGSKPKKTNRKLDVIDKLDVTSIYGTGLFHHDGPFDACNPHRNRQGSKRAPMQAFPKNSLNNVLGGGGPINKRPDHALFLGNKEEEAFNDYSKGGLNLGEFEAHINELSLPRYSKQAPNVMSATTRVEPIHGEETPGLGTSTFLEGAPASRNAMQRRASETVPVEANLSRSKSLAQKFRGINVPRRDFNLRATNLDNVVSPEARTPLSGKFGRGSNTFFDESLKSEDIPALTRKNASLTIIEPDMEFVKKRSGSISRLSSPLENQTASNGNGENPSVRGGIGFMNRVKSFKGGPRRMKTSATES